MSRSLPAQELTSSQRTWTDETGRFKVKASLKSFRDGKVKLEKADGLVVELPLNKLSDQDQAFVKKLEQDSQMENPFAGGDPANPFDGGSEPWTADEKRRNRLGTVTSPLKIELPPPARRMALMTKGWESIVDPAPQSTIDLTEAGTISLPSFAGRFASSGSAGSAFVDRNGTLALVSSTNSYEKKCIVSIVDFAKGKVLDHTVIGYESVQEKVRALAIDSDRKEIITLYKHMGREPGRIEFRSFDNLDEPCDAWQTAGIFDRDGFNPQAAYPVGPNRLLTVGENLILWDREKREPIYVAKLGLHSVRPESVALSPGGNFIAISSGGSVVFVRIETGEAVGELDLHLQSIAFSPDGTRLAGKLVGRELLIFDLSTGEELQRFSTKAIGPLAWLDNHYLMIGVGRVFDLNLQTQVWEYNGVGSRGLTVLPNGITLVKDRNKLKAVKLPHIDLSQQTESLDKDELRLIEDGSEFAIKLETPYDDDTNNEVLEKLKASLAEQGFGYNADSELVIEAKVIKGKERTVNVRDIGPFSIFGRNIEKMTYTSHRSTIRILRAGKSIWNTTFYHGPEAMVIHPREDESLQEYADRVCKPEPRVLYSWKIPTNTFVLPEGKLLGKTNVWEL